ncbi:MAG: hypothetical protein LC789_12535 [Actinobacteria bacterium]|nr:hypothetical protein [Actinomycetota bacterium]MCA1720228.1 hypothetical protein [Actinomycetota bacterium]
MRVRTALVAAAAAAVALPLVAQASAPTDAVGLAKLTAARLGTTLALGPEPLSSSNVDLVATIPGTYIGMAKVGKDRLVATGTDGLSTFDISNPAAPKPLAVLPIAHFENEDVDTDGRLALISEDRLSKSRGAVLYVVDLANMSAPKLASVLNLTDVGADERGAGHIANCVAPAPNSCRTVWLTGGARVLVVDLTDPTKPVVKGAFASPASDASVAFGDPKKPNSGATHDVERDSTGTLWVTGSGGAFAYRLTNNPLKPRLLTGSGKEGVRANVNDFILHNSKRATKSTLLITEEDYVDESETPPGGCRGQGKFQTWNVDGADAGRPMKLQDQWKTEVQGTPFVSGNKAPVTANCSSHWFEESKGIAAVGWYEQGTRLLDVRNPKKISQIGYWLPPNAVTWGAYWITDDLVYTADVGRGIDVLKVNRKAAKATVAPIRAEWLGAAPRTDLLKASKAWGWGCATMAEHA